MRVHRAQPAEVSLLLARDDALVFGTLEGTHRHPERLSRRFNEAVAAAGRDLGFDVVPPIRLPDDAQVSTAEAAVVSREGAVPCVIEV